MTVQDDKREQEMRALLGFRKGEGRAGVDAYYDFKRDGAKYAAPLELKSTTKEGVSTARDVGMPHIEKWRKRIWVFGFYDSAGAELLQLAALGPADMESWIGRIERYIAPDFAIGEQAALRLGIEDLHIVCGEKPVYSVDDARNLHKRQWDKAKYESRKDTPDGYTPERMLEILKLRAKYLNNRGATLNNPHIPKSFFKGFQQRFIDARSKGAANRIRSEIRAMVLADKALRRMAVSTA